MVMVPLPIDGTCCGGLGNFAFLLSVLVLYARDLLLVLSAYDIDV